MPLEHKPRGIQVAVAYREDDGRAAAGLMASSARTACRTG